MNARSRRASVRPRVSRMMAGTGRQGHRENDVQSRGAELRDDNDVEHQRREREHQIGNARQHLVQPSAPVSGEQSRRDADGKCQRGCERGVEEHGARAPDNARQDIAANMVSPEPEHRSAGCDRARRLHRHDRLVGRERRDPGRSQSYEYPEPNDGKPATRHPAVPDLPDPCEARRGEVRGRNRGDLGVTHAVRILGLSAR